ncbi:type VI secretion system protein TssA [Vibrio tapetis subsp. quintayensis]|uniref:type VI secretion system protein TssA n=1 Tax=Vibrio tapetis TaxID=52443 RepID=UPI0025B2FC9D|nr:type VI secretion system protein TssA [Vibrio tapetis]MDN3681079.1 type VI secretion system protein TssA [Vibrio tapetis subsp. quintayensis]
MESQEPIFDWVPNVLEAISEQSPTGTDLRSDISPESAYFYLKDQRMVARNEERNAIVDDEPISHYANLWRVFLDVVPEQLTSVTKDLELVAWLIEALTRLHGFKGLAQGYEIAVQLIDQYWDGLYPMPDEDGVETRVAGIIGLNGIEQEGTLLFPIASIPLTQATGGKSYAYWEYQQAVDIEKLDDDKKRQRIDSGSADLQSIKLEVEGSSNEFYQQLYLDLNQAIDTFKRYSQAMDKACAEPMPSSYIDRKLEAIKTALEHLVGERLRPTKPIIDDTEVQSTEPEGGSTEGAQVSTGLLAANLTSREQAISQLSNIAEFFKLTEPHSPVSYSIEQVVRWCDMPLPELLAELISDGEAKNGYFRLVGIANKNDE